MIINNNNLLLISAAIYFFFTGDSWFRRNFQFLLLSKCRTFRFTFPPHNLINFCFFLKNEKIGKVSWEKTVRNFTGKIKFWIYFLSLSFFPSRKICPFFASQFIIIRNLTAEQPSTSLLNVLTMQSNNFSIGRPYTYKSYIVN